LPNPDARERGGVQTNLRFRETESAQKTLAEVQSKLSPALATTLPSLLADCPDSDSALLMFDRLLHESPGDTVQLLERHPDVAHYALTIFGYSRFLGETLLQNPDLLHSFRRQRYFDQSLGLDDLRKAWIAFQSTFTGPDASSLLARFKRREYIRIMLRDVLGIAPLAETTAEISALADVLIEAALEEAEKRLRARRAEFSGAHGAFTILSLGKLGGNELNYSSDVDLFYVFAIGHESPDTAFSHREYFIRLAQQVTEILSCATREGAVFRIDLRLRPQGSQGELAVSLNHALHYYLTAAHDWERQALIKARYSAGDPDLAREFIHSVQAHIYTQATNLAAIATALETREKINTRGRKPAPHPLAPGIDVKRDPGGIRDIEFLVQCLQRVYGGAESWLRSSGTLFSLQKLHDKRHIGGKDFQELSSTYVFLRHLEHRLQLRQGQQTHRLPDSREELMILQRSLKGTIGQGELGDLVSLVRQRMAAVAEIYHRVIQQQRQPREDQGSASYALQSAPSWITPDQSNDEILRRFAADSPALFTLATGADLNAAEKRNLFRFLSAALTSSERYAVVLRHPEAIALALKLFAASEYLTQILIRHPEEIATLSELPQSSSEGSGYLFDTSFGGTRANRDAVFAYVASSEVDDNERLAMLRRHYRHRIFASGARDVIECRAVYNSLGSTTSAAEDAIAAAFGIAGSAPDLAVLALGRLGSGEFDVLSDADLLFVCGESSDRVALTKCAERIVQALAAYTRDGMVFPVDTRLRPHGREGELLVSPSQLMIYYTQEAQPWEALTYTKLRSMAGSRNLAERAMAATTTLFQRFAADPAFLGAIREMREKLESVESESSLKTSAGAVYDIDFLSSFLLVKNRIAGKHGTLRDRLWRCAAAGLLSNSDAAALDHAAELFRTVDHVLRLITGRASKGLPANEQSWAIAERLTRKILQREFPAGLEAELEEMRNQVRASYARILKP
jgi:glutamate-ammonia-ligase adenylyltransferase